MDSFCDDLLLAIFQFVHPADRFQFILLGKKYHNVVSEYIASPEWIYEQIDQFIKKNVAVDFSLRCNAPNEYLDYLQEHIRNKHWSGKCRDPDCHGANEFFAQQLGIDIMTCDYERNNNASDDCCNCTICGWLPRSPTAQNWDMHSIQNAPPHYSPCTTRKYHEYILDSILEQPSVKYCVYWTPAGRHTSELNILGRDKVAEYARNGECLNGSIIPIQSVYESIGIIVHNMTGIKQIRRNLLDYDIAHLRLFYIVNFLASNGVIRLPVDLRHEQCIDALRYFTFVEHVLQNHVRKNIEMLMVDRVGPTRYIFMIHPEIESKAAEVAKHVILFGTK